MERVELNRDLAPQLHDDDVRLRLLRFADTYDLVLNENVIHKLDWSEEHGGRCFCDWEGRPTCPCPHVFEDMSTYGGSCLCNLLMTPEHYAEYIKRKETPKPKLSKEEKKLRKQRLKERQAEAEKVFKKIKRG